MFSRVDAFIKDITAICQADVVRLGDISISGWLVGRRTMCLYPGLTVSDL